MVLEYIQINRAEQTTEINSHLYEQLLFNQGPEALQEREEVPFKKNIAKTVKHLYPKQNKNPTSIHISWVQLCPPFNSYVGDFPGGPVQ